jgi:hypothetical protein
MRPASHSDTPPEKRCGNCIFSRYLAIKEHLLCFHGDSILDCGGESGPGSPEYIELDGDLVNFMEGEEYDRVWAGRVVDSSDVCDEWVGDGREQ